MICAFLFLINASFLISGLLYERNGWFKNFFHNILKWHIPNDEWSFDSAHNAYSTCIICGKMIKRNPSGNWSECYGKK